MRNCIEKLIARVRLATRVWKGVVSLQQVGFCFMFAILKCLQQSLYMVLSNVYSWWFVHLLEVTKILLFYSFNNFFLFQVIAKTKRKARKNNFQFTSKNIYSSKTKSRTRLINTNRMAMVLHGDCFLTKFCHFFFFFFFFAFFNNLIIIIKIILRDGAEQNRMQIRT